MSNSISILDFIPSPVLTEDNGVGHGVARIARAGVYQYYAEELKRGGVDVPDGVSGLVNVFRSPDDIKNTAHLFDATPIVLDHSWVSPSNIESKIRGLSEKVKYVNGWLETPISLWGEALKAAQTTHQQFSNGYDAEFTFAPGQWVDTEGIQGEKGKEYKYDFIQTPTKKNHIALVKQARAGNGATFIGDSVGSKADCCKSIIYFEDDFMDKDQEKKGLDVSDMIPLKVGEWTGYLSKDMAGYMKDMFSKMDGMFKSMDMGGMKMYDMKMGDMSYSLPMDMAKAFDPLVGMMKKGKMSDSLDFVEASMYQEQLESAKQLKKENYELKGKIQDQASQLAQATDPANLEKLLKERQEAFDKAKPFLDGVEFSASTEAIAWQKQALVKGGFDSTVVDSYTPEQVESAFTALTLVKPKEVTPAYDAFGDKIANWRSQEPVQSGVSDGSREDLPQNRQIPSISSSAK